MEWRKFSVLSIALVLAAAMLAEAQRPGLFTTLQTTSTGASSLLVGCAANVSTACSGSIKSGTIAITAAIPSVLMDESDATATNRVWRFTPNGEALVLQALSDDASTGNTIFQVERTGTTVDSFTVAPAFVASGTLTGSSALYLTNTQNITTTSGANAITTLAATTVMLRITTGGSGADDDITAINGGAAGRHLWVCWVAETGAGDGPLTSSPGGFIAGLVSGVWTLGQCNELVYDGTSSTWRATSYF